MGDSNAPPDVTNWYQTVPELLGKVKYFNSGNKIIFQSSPTDSKAWTNPRKSLYYHLNYANKNVGQLSSAVNYSQFYNIIVIVIFRFVGILVRNYPHSEIIFYVLNENICALPMPPPVVKWLNFPVNCCSPRPMVYLVFRADPRCQTNHADD